MFHTNFKELVDKIKLQEQREVKMAALAHGGRYVMEQDEESQLPRITVYFQGFTDSVDQVDVTEVIVKNDKLFIKGKMYESCEEVEFPAEQVYPGELHYVLDSIKPTKDLDSTMAHNYNVFEDTIDLQEISSQAVSEIMNKIDCDRFTAFEMCQKWADEFTEKFRNHNWGDDDMSYYDHIDFFIEQKLKEL